jgi:hypothetical protein
MFDFSLHLLDGVAALGDVKLFNHLVDRGASPLQSSALHRASVCHDEQKSLSMISCLIDRHRLELTTRLYDGYNDVFDYGPGCGTPLGSAIYNRNLSVAAELLRRVADKLDLTWPIQGALGGSAGIEYQESALVLLMEVGGASAQKVLSEAIRSDELQGAMLSLRRGADAALALREQIEEDGLAAAQDNTPNAATDVVYPRKTSRDMRSLLERWTAQSATCNEASRL